MNSKIYTSDLIIDYKIDTGGSGKVYTCQFDNNKYAYKEFFVSDKYRAFAQPRLENISQFYGNPNFIFHINLFMMILMINYVVGI